MKKLTILMILSGSALGQYIPPAGTPGACGTPNCIIPGSGVVGGIDVIPDQVSVAAFGYCTPLYKTVCALADGSSHAISAGDIAANPQWLGTYVAGDQWDYVALQEAEYAAFGGPGAEHGTNSYQNKRLYIPEGRWWINKPWTFTQVFGGEVYGAGRLATKITQTSTSVATVVTNGAAYTSFKDFYLSGASTNTGATFDLDWNGSGSVSLQSNTIENVYFQGAGAASAFGLRIGHTGYMGSETLMLNCAWDSYGTAAVQTENFNALSNTIVGGNIASCPKYGVYGQYGSISVYNTGFQNGTIAQLVFDGGGDVVNDSSGVDIYYVNAANITDVVSGVRSESIRLLTATGQHRVVLTGSTSTPAYSRWLANHAYGLNEVVTGTLANSNGALFRAKVAGTSGGSEPSWPLCCTVGDGSVTWAYLGQTVVSGDGLTLNGNNLPWGTADLKGQNGFYSFALGNYFSRADWVQNGGLVFSAANTVTVGGPLNDNNGVISVDITKSPNGLQDASSAAKPTCAVALRGTFYSEKGAPGVADQPFLCAHKGDNSYAWVQLVTVP